MTEIFWSLLAVFALVLVVYLAVGFYLSWRERERERERKR